MPESFCFLFKKIAHLVARRVRWLITHPRVLLEVCRRTNLQRGIYNAFLKVWLGFYLYILCSTKMVAEVSLTCLHVLLDRMVSIISISLAGQLANTHNRRSVIHAPSRVGSATSRLSIEPCLSPEIWNRPTNGYVCEDCPRFILHW